MSDCINDPYAYLLVHFLEDPDGYAERIYLDVSDGDNPHRWIPLNGGRPVLTSDIGTTGVRDPHIIRNPQTGMWYIIATDLRVFGGDNGGWYEWSHHASTNLIVWQSPDLLHWEGPRMLDVSQRADGTHMQLGMAWACECLWVPDYYPEEYEGDRGAFVMYWSSTVFDDADTAHDDNSVTSSVLWGATTDFTQDTFEFGGVLIDTGGDSIDTTMVQRPLPDGGCARIASPKTIPSATAFGWTTPMRGAGGNPTRNGMSYNVISVRIMWKTAIPAVWKVPRYSLTITTTVGRTTNGICSWTSYRQSATSP